jgi:hypothetical protein
MNDCHVFLIYKSLVVDQNYNLELEISYFFGVTWRIRKFDLVFWLPIRGTCCLLIYYEIFSCFEPRGKYSRFFWNQPNWIRKPSSNQSIISSMKGQVKLLLQYLKLKSTSLMVDTSNSFVIENSLFIRLTVSNYFVTQE